MKEEWLFAYLFCAFRIEKQFFGALNLGLNSDLKYKRTINICISERKWQYKISILAIGVASKHMKDSLKIIKMSCLVQQGY